MQNWKNLGKRVYELRRERELSQQEVADAIGVSQTTIGRIENGKIDVGSSTLLELAKFFNISSDYLLGIEEE
ncbi:MAG: helix-turn-helix domain-containing protein [Firmicutes bacterium]|nr:helix-turn-helix domain-containing protein [Bacillota bacterium]